MNELELGFIKNLDARRLSSITDCYREKISSLLNKGGIIVHISLSGILIMILINRFQKKDSEEVVKKLFNRERDLLLAGYMIKKNVRLRNA